MPEADRPSADWTLQQVMPEADRPSAEMNIDTSRVVPEADRPSADWEKRQMNNMKFATRRCAVMKDSRVEWLSEPLSKSGRRPDPQGMTLIEVLIVIALLLAIGGLVVVNLLPKKAQADIDLAKVQMNQIGGALKMFRADIGRYPTDDEGLRALTTKEAIEDETVSSQWKGPYLEQVVDKDKWGSEWIYRQESEESPSMYELISPGPDREEGTDDDISNIDSGTDSEGGSSTGNNLDDLG